mmetsp:Transcript_25781/g.61157  ORF Transcript_25781/g.61157 Transcript_25781/m.61157 type:complete len:339 (-) Transcript_25781:1037-2053(-)
MHPVIAGGGGEEHLRTHPPLELRLLARGIRLGEEEAVVAEAVVGGVLPDELPVVCLRVPVLAHPGSASEELREDLHVQERNLADSSAEEFGGHRPRQHVSYQQPAVAASDNGELRGGRDAPRHQILAYGFDILVCLVPKLLQRCLMPSRPVLTTATDVCDHLDTALLKPAGADPPRVVGQHRDLKPAVRVEERGVGPVHRNVLAPHSKVRDLGAVLAGSEVLLADQAVGLEHRRLRPQLCRHRAPVLRAAHLLGVRHQEALPRHPHVVGLGVVTAHALHSHVLPDRHRLSRPSGLRDPLAVLEAPELKHRAHILESLEDDIGLGLCLLLEGLGGGRFE